MSDIAITEAVRSTILSSGVPFPQTTCPASVPAGSTTITVASGAALMPGYQLRFEDGSAEEPLPIASIAGNVITPDWAGLGYTGTVYAHAAACAVSANLLSEVPNDIDAMLAVGDPVVFVMVLQDDTYQADSGRSQSIHTVHVEYRRQLNPPSGGATDTNLFAFRQQRQARKDLKLIELALLRNRSLGGLAEGLGQPGASRPLVQRAWNKIVINTTTFQLQAAANFIVRETRQMTMRS